MREVLYRKYRSKSLDEIVGQEHITKTLKNALASGNVSHAYLFTGPRGVGKTSIARILAHEVNGLEYGSKTENLDIIEIDAASNRRIDEIRSLRDKVNVAPSSSKYKVYIIDEVHMLTKEAFNALLKTLEEPPQHVIFILATTELHKVPQTIVSRTQRFAFKPITESQAVAHLQVLAKKEKIDIDDEALQLLVEHSGGSFRDSISLLDQVHHADEKITVQTVRELIGIPPQSMITALLSAIEQSDAKQAFVVLRQLEDGGYQTAEIAKSLSAEIHSLLLSDQGGNENILVLARELLSITGSEHAAAKLELAILSACFDASRPASLVVDKKPKPQPEVQQEKVVIDKQPSEPAATNAKKKTPNSPPSTLDAQLWRQSLDAMKGKHNTLYGIARMAEPSFEDNKIVLGFAFPFHYRRCNETRNKQRLTAVVSDIAGHEVEVSVELIKKPGKDASPNHDTTVAKSDTLDSITKVFGGGEMLD